MRGTSMTSTEEAVLEAAFELCKWQNGYQWEFTTPNGEPRCLEVL